MKPETRTLRYILFSFLIVLSQLSRTIQKTCEACPLKCRSRGIHSVMKNPASVFQNQHSLCSEQSSENTVLAIRPRTTALKKKKTANPLFHIGGKDRHI